MGQKRTRKAANIPAGETKEQRFIRIVKPRVQSALKRISVIGNCAGQGYAYTPEQANQIVKALLDACTTLKAKFDKAAKTEASFEFGKQA